MSDTVTPSSTSPTPSVTVIVSVVLAGAEARGRAG
jgi:hypothetical protein